MKQSSMLVALACSLAVGIAGAAHAGAPQPDQRQGEFAHVCRGGPNKGLACTVPTEAVDCPKSECIVQTLSRAVTGTLTLIAHDNVTDWLNGGATNRAITGMLEVRAPDGSRQILSATYQDLTAPSESPQAPGNIVAIAMDEAALVTLAKAADGLRFIQPAPALSEQLQELFGVTGTPVLVDAAEKRIELSDHTADDLATVLRFKVRVQFVEPL